MGRNAAAGLPDKRLYDLDELKKRIIDVWHGQNILDYAINEWHKRLRAYIRGKGGHFEHLL